MGATGRPVGGLDVFEFSDQPIAPRRGLRTSFAESADGCLPRARSREIRLILAKTKPKKRMFSIAKRRFTKPYLKQFPPWLSQDQVSSYHLTEKSGDVRGTERRGQKEQRWVSRLRNSPDPGNLRGDHLRLSRTPGEQPLGSPGPHPDAAVGMDDLRRLQSCIEWIKRESMIARLEAAPALQKGIGSYRAPLWLSKVRARSERPRPLCCLLHSSASVSYSNFRGRGTTAVCVEPCASKLLLGQRLTELVP
jgi:hypothetical protein